LVGELILKEAVRRYDMSDKPELGAMRIIKEGARLIFQRRERVPWVDPNSYDLTSWWRELASGKNLDELHEHFLKEFAYYKDPYIAVDSCVPQYITHALRAIEWVMRRRSG
jgi:hypothetical protein